MSDDIFHRAARDGYLDILREATRRDCDRADEDGMSPVLWAAYHGKLEALRLLVSRGGNPNRFDHLGRSALHHAAANGHMSCVTFLVHFGANIWALDNDLHTALDITAVSDHTEIVKFLDSIITKQTIMNKKVVRKLKEKAVVDAQKRIRKYEKLQSKAQRKALKEEKRLCKEREKMEVANSTMSSTAATRTEKFQRNMGGVRKSLTKSTFSEPKPYSAHFTLNSKNQKKPFMTGVAKKLRGRSIKSAPSEFSVSSEFKVRDTEMDGTKTLTSLSGLKRDWHIMYVRGNSTDSGEPGSKGCYTDNEYMKVRDGDTVSRAISEPDLTYTNNADSGVDSDSNPPEITSMFERPGFGSVAFMNRRMTHETLMSLPHDSQEGENDKTEEDVPGRDSAVSSPSGETPLKFHHGGSGTAAAKIIRHKQSLTDIDSIGTLGSLAARIKDLPWEDEDLLLDDDDVMESSPLELFLASGGLTEYISMFSREKIDLEALMLLSDADMKELGVPLGPRRKLQESVARRKQVLNKPGTIVDSVL